MCREVKQREDRKWHLGNSCLACSQPRKGLTFLVDDRDLLHLASAFVKIAI